MAYAKTKIQLRRDTAANWSSSNPTLLAGELGFDTTSKYIKIGDGSTEWNSLSTVRLPKEAIDNLIDINANTIYDLSANADNTSVALLSADGTVDSPSWTQVKVYSPKSWTSEIAAAKAAGELSASKVREDMVKDYALSADVTAISGSLFGKINTDVAAAIETAAGDATTKANAAESNAKAYTDAISTALSTDYVDKITAAEAAAKAAGELSAQAVRDTLVADYVPFLSVNGGKEALTGNNKIATLADVVGLSGSVHILGTIENDEETSLSSDQEVIVATYPDAKRGAIVINTTNSKEYVCMAEIGVTATTADWIELGSEGIYETKADATAKLKEAKEYTDTAISALDYADLSVANQFVTKVVEEDGVIAVSRRALVIGDIPDLKSLYDEAGSASDALEAAIDYTNSVSADLSSDYVGKIADSLATAKTYANSTSAYVDGLAQGYATTAETNAKGYTDTLSTTMDGKIDLKLDKSAVVGKVALSTLTEVDTALTGFVRDVKVNGTTCVADQVASLGVLAGKDIITTDLLSAAAVTTVKIADSAVTTDKINDGAITNAKLAASSVTAANLSGDFIWDCGGAN